MASVSRLALGIPLALGAASIVVSVPADAKKKPPYTGPSFTLEERTSLSALEAALAARNYPAATAALATAQAAARGSDARYLLAGLQLRLGRETGNTALQASAVEALLSSGRVPAAEQAPLHYTQGVFAAFAGKRERAETSLSRALELSPNPDTAIALARVKLDLRKNNDAVALIDRAIELQAATGRKAPEAWYRRGLALATMNNLGPQAIKFSRALVSAYPTSENWRDAVLIYRDYAKPDPATNLDAARLQRLSRALAGERDYLEAAQAFEGANLPGEAQSVFQEGVNGRMIDPAKATFKEAIAASQKRATAAKGKLATLRTTALAAPMGATALEAGDQFLSFGDYAAAAELYQAALVKGGIDPNVGKTRLGIALALAGRRAEADAAFNAVGGARADLASLWRVWLSQRA
jgi:tetratricopeptide (TPR) repeat protein